jgi:hypothetical protein
MSNTRKSAVAFLKPYTGVLPDADGAGSSLSERRLLLYSYSGLSVSTAVVVTEQDDSVSAATTIRIAASFAVTEGGDTLFAVGAVGPQVDETTGQRLVSLSGLTGVSAGAHLVALGSTGSTAGELLVDASTLSTGSAIQHLLAIQQSTGTKELSASIVEQGDTPAATTAVRVVAEASIVEADDSITAAAARSSSFVALLTEGDDSVAAESSVLNRASAQIAEQNDGLESAYTTRVFLAGAATEGNDSASGELIKRTRVELAVIEGGDAVAGTGAVQVKVIGAAGEGDDALTSEARNLRITVSVSLFEETDFPTFRVGVRALAESDLGEGDDSVTVLAFQQKRGTRRRLAIRPRPIYMRKFRR